MSIVAAIKASYENSPKRRPGTGYPTGSRFGTCTAQLQMLRFPAVTKPEPFPTRSVMTFEEGDRIEAWLGERLEAAFPNRVGLRQEPFYFSVPLETKSQVDEVRTSILGRHLWGTIQPGFQPPTVRIGEDGRVKWRPVVNKKMGFVLDPGASVVWAPTYVDFAILHPELGLVVVEVKSMSNYAARRAILGDLDYGKRCQLAGIASATGADVVLIGYRKETSHLAEIAYTRNAERVRVILTAPNGSQEVFFVTPTMDKLLTDAGEAREFPADLLWDSAETWTPYDESLLETIRERVRRVLLATPGVWDREYGPSFVCGECAGVGTTICKNCGGRGIGKTSTTGRQCGRCKGTLKQPCAACDGRGSFEEVALPTFPCGYCPVVGACYPFARLEVTDKPKFLVNRSDWEASGMSFTRPEPAISTEATSASAGS